MKKVLILLFVALNIAIGQSYTPRLQGQMNTIAGLSFETWSAKSDRITQFALPITFVYPINPRSRIDVITSPAFSSLNSGDSHSLNGMSDIRLRGHYLTQDERYLFTFGLVLPSGKNALTVEEYNVANALSVKAMNFRVPYLGQGRDINLGIATAYEFGEYVLGAGVSYLMKDNFEPFADYEYDYQPGNEFTLTGGLERNVTLMNRDMRVTADLVYTLYGSDQGNDEDIFKSGNRFMLQGTLRAPMNSFDMILFIREKIKGKNKTGVGDVFKEERKNSNGNEFEIMGQLLFPPKNNVRYSALFDVKLYGNNEWDTGGATLFGFGGGYQRPLGTNLVFDGGARFYFGNIKNTDESTGLTGIKLNGGIRYYFQ